MVVISIKQVNFVIMNRIILLVLSCCGLINLQAQESLLLGELNSEDIYLKPRTDGAIKVSTYSFKYSKKGKYLDSTLVSFEQYDENGYISDKVSFSGKEGQNSNSFKYTFDKGKMMAFGFLSIHEQGNYGRQGEFNYDSKNRLIFQKHALANIHYAYYEHGGMRTKSYYYDNKESHDTEPWVNYFIYDDSLNLIHVDTDEKSAGQTSYYNDKNELVKHDYYPGVAYSIYEYDLKGNCVKQIDYELDKKKWDSTVYVYGYNENNQLSSSGTEKRNGRVLIDEKRFYLANGELKEIVYYRKRKPRFIKRFIYQFDEE